MWQKSTDRDMYASLLPPEHSGWKKDNEGYEIDWEDNHVISKITGTIKFLTKGCSCKKGCATNICGCKKKNNHCGPGCECRGCTNVPGTHQQNVTGTDEDSSSSSDSDGTASDSEENDMETEIITDEFLLESSIIL